MLVDKVNGTLFVLMMHLCLDCGKYMPNDLGLDFWLRVMQGIWISHIRRYKKDSSLNSNETHHGWE